MIDSEKLEKYLKLSYNTIYHEPDTPDFHNKLIDQIYDDIISKYAIPKDSKILDLGCGAGYFLSKLAAEGFTNAEGITADKTDLACCAGIGVNAKIGDFTFTDYEDNSIDFLWCRQALEHSVWPYFTLLEINRILKFGQRAYIEVPAPDTSRFNEGNPNHFSVMGRKMWAELFKRAGFAVEFNEVFEFTMTDKVSDTIMIDHKEQFYLFMILKTEHMIGKI